MNSQNVFRFSHIASEEIKLSPLGREYLSSAVNMLRNSSEILHITMKDLFELNCLHSDQ